MNSQTLALLGLRLLANVSADLTATGVDVPDRQVLTYGQPVYDGDCGVLAVWVPRLDVGPGPGGGTTPRSQQGLTNLPAVHITSWAVELAVCAEERTAIPTAAEVTADGTLGLTLLWTLSRVLTNRWKLGTLFDPYGWAGGRGYPTVVAGGDPPLTQGGLITVKAQLSCFTQDVP